jgi:hypothetical protein
VASYILVWNVAGTYPILILNSRGNGNPALIVDQHKKVFFTLEEQVRFRESMSVKSKDATGHVKQKLRQRDDVSEKTGNPVRVSVDVDRRNPDETKVTHRVEEVDMLTGYPTKIHEDVKVGKAKYRPQNE